MSAEVSFPPPNTRPQGFQPRPSFHGRGGFMGPPRPRYPHHLSNNFVRPHHQQQQNSEGGANSSMDGGHENVNISEDGVKRIRKSMMRKTVDYHSSFLNMVEARVWQRRDRRDRPAIQPDTMYGPEIVPLVAEPENSANAAVSHFVKAATNKMRCPVFTLKWTPEGRRLITGASSGEFTLWNGLTFNFETILQAHDSPVRTMTWSNSTQWMVTGDHGGYVKYWQSNMNNVKMFQAHKEPVRRVSFSPTDAKFATASDDGTVRVFDFYSCVEERVLRGHGADVKCVDWHPTKGLLASGSKDNQQPVKIWEPKTGVTLATLFAHKSTVMDIGWNKNGNWLLTASRDHLLKLFDLRNLKEEVQTFRGHKKDASCLKWHPIYEDVFASGGSDGSIMFWNVGADKELGTIDAAHENIVWCLDWHPAGHILCSGSNDHTCKFWTRNRPGDTLRDRYNLNTQPLLEDPAAAAMAGASANANHSVGGSNDSAYSMGAASVAIPGMAPEDRVDESRLAGAIPSFTNTLTSTGIPGLDDDDDDVPAMLAASQAQGEKGQDKKKMPYAKPIPRNFQNSWNSEPAAAALPHPPPQQQQQQLEPQLPPDCISLQQLQQQVTAVVAFGNVYPVLPNTNLHMSIGGGEKAVKEVIRREYLGQG